MSDIFDAMHRAFFDQLFSLDEEGRKGKAQLLREAGVPEEMIADLTRPGILPGMSFGGAKPVDVTNVSTTPCRLPSLVGVTLFDEQGRVGPRVDASDTGGGVALSPGERRSSKIKTTSAR